MRLDCWLAENSAVKSRSAAQMLIRENKIKVNGIICGKNSFQVNDNDKIELIGELPKYVGRGGLKLEHALMVFSIKPESYICIDAGASTGGFTDCMLQNGAAKVYAVDVGNGQLDEKLKSDPRVISMENTDIRRAGEKINEKADLISVDVSFISLTLVLPHIKALLKNPGGQCAALIKPQFEVGKDKIGKNGIVKEVKYRREAVEKIATFSENIGFAVQNIIESPIKGGDGNIEYLIHLR